MQFSKSDGYSKDSFNSTKKDSKIVTAVNSTQLESRISPFKTPERRSI